MLKRKCPKCQNKMLKKYQFCPFCGFNFSRNSENDREDYGFLGRDDFEDNFDSMFNNFSMGKIIRGAMKMTEKMIKDIEQNSMPKKDFNSPNMDIQFFVNGKRVSPQNNQRIIKKQNQPKKINNEISKEKAKQFARLPRKEPKAVMKRLSGKIIYELSVPGVNDIDDILINQLENSIEIKALSKTKVYSKTLNLNLPILNYKLDEGNLILELQAR